MVVVTLNDLLHLFHFHFHFFIDFLLPQNRICNTPDPGGHNNIVPELSLHLLESLGLIGLKLKLIPPLLLLPEPPPLSPPLLLKPLHLQPMPLGLLPPEEQLPVDIPRLQDILNPGGQHRGDVAIAYLRDNQLELETELEQVVEQLVGRERHEHQVRQGHVRVRVCLKVEVVQEGAQEHLEVEFQQVGRVLQHVYRK